MPTISRFYGIKVGMFHSDHHPAHFHATYGEHEVVIEIESLAPRRGGLPRRAQDLLLEWAVMHRQELVENWRLARAKLPLRPIEPLD